MHASVAAGTGVILVLAFGPLLLLSAVVVVGVCWSRVRLGDHTTAQVLTGSAVGVVIAAVVFGLLR